MRDLLLAIWRYRYFIMSSVKNDLRARFIRSKLGAVWMIIHPLAQVLIFALILSEVLAAKLPGVNSKYAYALYLLGGTLGWALFTETVTKFGNLFIENGNLMRKMAFPRICLPLIAAGTTLVNNLLLLLAIFLVFAALGHFPDEQALWLPVLIAVTLMLAGSIGLLLGVLNVFMRDIGQIIPVVLQALFWMTPIVYSITILPESYRNAFKLNPLYPLITSYQNVLVFGTQPDWAGLGTLAVASLVLTVVALFAFRRASPEMVDVL
ncbi:ABC transporter permease [Lysobacter enzymogenes]|uniref:ABC transporter permease n=1 Tax=Lysobacter enzymogenes TaxID=69 RepID=UPI001A96B940|nr:ABC transporter permease [Lysobacter enzymogenes]QQP98621.1 ABC transporter permease [Lysobacter enzymogenes]